MPIFGLRLGSFCQTCYYSGPDGLNAGDYVLVDAEQGLTFAQVASGPISALSGVDEQTLPVILRQASSEDMEKNLENANLARDADAFCRCCIQERRLDMRLVDVEVFFDRSKFVFYFTAPARIDFRDLVKDLVREYRVRIELRQIGVRHETQMVGAVGNCGMVCCCRRYLRKFAPVTIRMAKEQNLFLNPAKISGICGRLLCCLAYEQDNYDRFHRQCPRLGKKYQTSRGAMRLVRTNMFRNSLLVLTENNEEIELTLEEWQELDPRRSDTSLPVCQSGQECAVSPHPCDDGLLVVSATPETIDPPEFSDSLPEGEHDSACDDAGRQMPATERVEASGALPAVSAKISRNRRRRTTRHENA